MNLPNLNEQGYSPPPESSIPVEPITPCTGDDVPLYWPDCPPTESNINSPMDY